MSYWIMKKILSVLAIILLIIFLSIHAKAKEGYEYVEPACYYVPQKIRCTCYCEHQGTATLDMPYYGVAAGKKEWMWDIAELNAINEDGSIGEFIGYFEIRDTGAGMDTDGDGKGDSIKNGMSIDVWVNSLVDAYEWRDKYGDYVYIKLIKSDW